MSSFASRAKRLPGVSPSAQTLGSRLQRLGARHHRWAAVAAEARTPFFLGASAVCVSKVLRLFSFVVRAHAAVARSPGTSLVVAPRFGVPLVGRCRVGASALSCARRSLAWPASPSRWAAARACARRQPMAGSASSGCRSPRRRFSLRRSTHRLSGSSPASRRGCCLTLRSSGRPPASQLGREALSAYHAPRGQAVFPAPAPQLKR